MEPPLELSVVMPCLNEARTVETCVRKALEAMAKLGVKGEVIVADNGSTDGSPEIAQRAGARVVHVTRPGYGSALLGGIAAARGIALSAGKPAIGLTTLATFAAPFIAADDTLPVVVAIDARHDHVYLQVFGPGGRTLVAPRVAPVREALRVSATGAPRVTGTAAAKLASLWPAGERAPAKVDQRGAPDITWVARLGAAASETNAPPKPLYLRPPDAHPQDAVQLARR